LNFSLTSIGNFLVNYFLVMLVQSEVGASCSKQYFAFYWSKSVEEKI
jgi:hypothetical protein